MAKSRKCSFIKQRSIFKLEIVSKRKNKISQGKCSMDSKSGFRHLFPTGIKDQADVTMQSGHTGTASQGPKVTFCFLNMGPEPFLSSSSNIQREMPELSKAPNLCWMTSLLWLGYVIPTFREIFLWISWLCDFSLMWLFPEHL